MSREIVRTTVLALLQGDESLYDQLCAEGLLPRDESALSHQHLELARVVYTLTRELEVNWAGVEIVLRMRSELIASRQQVSELLELLQRKRDER